MEEKKGRETISGSNPMTRIVCRCSNLGVLQPAVLTLLCFGMSKKDRPELDSVSLVYLPTWDQNVCN